MFRFVFLTTALFTILVTAPAQAALVVNYSSAGPVVMSNLQIGQEGSVNSFQSLPPAPNFLPSEMGSAIGSLGAGTKITFTYTSAEAFSPSWADGSITALAGFEKTVGLNFHSGEAILAKHENPSILDVDYSRSSVNYKPDANSLILAVANFTSDRTATLEIINKSSFTAGFISSLFKWGRSNLDLVTYKISAVPLPAALPLFGAGLFGLAAFRRQRKANA